MVKVLLAAGHGLRPDGSWDPGATAPRGNSQYPIVEHDMNERAMWACQDRFIQMGFTDYALEKGATRLTNDRLDGNWTRFRQLVWTAPPEVAVEFHHDWSGAKRGGFGIWPKAVGYSAAREKRLCAKITEVYGRWQLPVRPSYADVRGLGLLYRPKCCTVIWECDRVGSDMALPEDTGRAVAEGIIAYLGWHPPFDHNYPVLGPHVVNHWHDVLARVEANYKGTDLSRLSAILAAYWQVCTATGVSFLVALAQAIHEETGWFNSFWSHQNNFARIGVTGAHAPAAKPGMTFNPQRNRWETGLSFVDPAAGVTAHVGRLLAYTTPALGRTKAQHDAVTAALNHRPLPSQLIGSVTAVRELGAAYNRTGTGWAVPGTTYGAAIAEKMKLLAS